MDTLKIIADNQALTLALRDILEQQFALDDLDITQGNAVLGEVVRARLEGMKKIESAFKEIAKHKTYTVPPPPENRAR